MSSTASDLRAAAGRQSSELDGRLTIRLLADASAYAADLFRESFGTAFPTPHAIRYGAVQAQPEDWLQGVALYRWPDGAEECVGFANWIRFRNAYLGGALCVKRNFYRRLPRAHFAECNRRGGIAQMIMEFGDRLLTHCDGWFAYCGDTKSLRVNARVGFVPTAYPYIIVKWVRPPDETTRRALIDEVAALGPF